MNDSDCSPCIDYEWECSDPPPGIVRFTVSVKNERKQPTLQRLGNRSVNAH